ncbi:methyl-accepting chemotaxis protein [Paenibacillus baekrokdamisoli]|uniref:Methyl-accepting chemotaxis protein n=1 Tax=Paenibacillus baekrokdamisoli TaxID=1712516 RepID=A0A3G9IPV2_9BACL|nr:methyl-accepting chemotaxis protein [Paenibacillus baekrokdamisoli]MBB3072094.1 methyl-accepting chemotaxis protein [Paenibacillus baekrokdamisoli]BBH20396.1 methyl-accepting chemotaxis protein [Paenibacillus baekrokdamisoli]
MRLRSVKAKTLLLFLPLLLVIVIAISSVLVLSARGLLIEQTQDNMKEQLANTNQSIQKRISSHGRVSETIAKSVQSHYTKLNLEDYDALFKNTLDVNPDTFGVGIFFEPNVYNDKTRYFSSYAYHDQNQITVTHDYSDPKYNYLSQEWYKIAVNQKGIRYTDPSYDEETKSTLVTASVPVYDDKQRFIAVITGDINLNTVQKIVSDTKVGASGWAFMLDKNGTYLAGPQTDKIMKEKLQDDKDPVLSTLANTIMKEGNGASTYTSSQGLVHVYYSKLEQTDWILAVALPDQELNTKINALMLKILIVILIGIVLIVVVILLYTRNLTAHTTRVNTMAEYLAQGDFTYSIEVKSKDEFGRMTENLNRTSGILNKMLSKVSEHSLHVASTSEELAASADQTSTVAENIANTIQDVAIGAETQLRGTQESTKALEELAIGIQRISESSSTLYDASQNTSQQAQQGNGIIQQAVRDMNEANHSVSFTTSLMDQLRNRSVDIGNIINVISGISEQTNLLSLNAGIEAARAGEHGRGFAVVASEIRKLSEQTKHSAEKVREIIEEMQGETEAAAKSVESGSKAVYASTTLVEQAGEAFTGIVSEIQHIVSQIQEVSAVSEQMLASSQQISATMEELARISGGASDATQSVAAASEQQLASMQEVSASAKSLSSMVQEQQDLLVQFKI